MRTLKTILASAGRNWAAILLGVVIFAPFAGAASSFTYQTFTALIGNNVQPNSTSLSYATQLQSPALVRPATQSVSGSLAGGPLYAVVVATSQTGTSSPSVEFATTTIKNKSLLFTWPPVPGATGYALYVGTSTPGSEQSYFATTTKLGVPNSFKLTSTSTPVYFPLGWSGAGFYLSGGSATTTLDTTGVIRSRQISTTTACSASLNGAMFYSLANKHLWLCTGAGAAWTLIK